MKTHFSIFDCCILEFNQIHSRSGNITSVENMVNIPFNVKRIYYLYDVPGGAQRGGHAHKELHQLIVAAGGRFDVILDDGKSKKIVELNRPYYGLLIVPGIWREIVNFSSGATCLVLASHKYDESDYLREYSDFLNYKTAKLLSHNEKYTR
jgi:dTDP-4-dehydrorhamnose 3,5-epimerase-like enzyme